MFNLHIRGELGNVQPTEVATPSSAFGIAWKNFLREIDTAGVKITSAHLDNAGKQTSLPVDIHATA